LNAEPNGVHRLVTQNLSSSDQKIRTMPGQAVRADGVDQSTGHSEKIDQIGTTVAKAEKSVALLIQRGDSKIFVPVNFSRAS
jgi:hypothetical protein